MLQNIGESLKSLWIRKTLEPINRLEIAWKALCGKPVIYKVKFIGPLIIDRTDNLTMIGGQIYVPKDRNTNPKYNTDCFVLITSTDVSCEELSLDHE